MIYVCRMVRDTWKAPRLFLWPNGSLEKNERKWYKDHRWKAAVRKRTTTQHQSANCVDKSIQPKGKNNAQTVLANGTMHYRKSLILPNEPYNKDMIINSYINYSRQSSHIATKNANMSSWHGRYVIDSCCFVAGSLGLSRHQFGYKISLKQATKLSWAM